MFVNFLRRANLPQRALVVHHRQPVRDTQSNFLIVRHVENRNAEFALQGLDLKTHFLAQIRVKVAQWLIEQQQARLGHQRTRQCHALLLATRKLRRQARFQTAQTNQINRAVAAFLQGGACRVRQFERVGHIGEHAHVRPDGVILKDHAQTALVGRQSLTAQGAGNHFPTDRDTATVGRLEAGDQAHQNGLAAARRTQQRKALAVLDLERQARQNRAPRVALAYPLNLNTRHRLIHFCMMSVNFLMVASFSAMICL